MEVGSGQLASNLIGRVCEELSPRASQNRFVDLLEVGGLPRERLTWLGGEQFRIVGSDQRSFALLAARRRMRWPWSMNVFASPIVSRSSSL